MHLNPKRPNWPRTRPSSPPSRHGKTGAARWTGVPTHIRCRAVRSGRCLTPVPKPLSRRPAMTAIVQNVDLSPDHEGFEPCAAQAFDVALYSGNWFAAYSTDGGNTFASLDPFAMMKLEGETFCCDQRVEFVPNLGSFVWVMLSMEGPLILAVATPDEIR